MTPAWTWLQTRRLGLAGWAAVLAFCLLVGRFWHPHYGFTSWLQVDDTDYAVAIPELKARPIYVYPGQNGYDGASYAQIAFHPLLDSPGLVGAIDNASYRARRILGSAMAWVLAGGNPVRIARVYAALNLGVWLGLALLLWRLLPVTDARSWVAWAGLLFSAGALHSVRLALTDLLGVTLFAAAMRAQEKGRSRQALGWLAAAGLARETVLAGVVAVWRIPWSAATWRRNLLRSVVVAAPLLVWIGYIRWKFGAASQGFGNFTWPVAGWLEKWRLVMTGYQRNPGYAWLNTATLLATLALTVQALYFLRHRRADDPWWRTGLIGVVMMALLGRAVWEGHPGAATRVLLPMSLAFAVLVVRQRASWPWLVAGNLSVLSGVMALWEVPVHPQEIAAGRVAGGSFVVRLMSGWYGHEHAGKSDWAWAEREGEFVIETWPAGGGPRTVQLGLRALGPRRVELRQGARVVWSGNVGAALERIEFTAAAGAPVRLRTEAPPVLEAPGARALGVAIYDLEVR